MYPVPQQNHVCSIEFANTGVVSITSKSTLEIGSDGNLKKLMRQNLKVPEAEGAHYGEMISSNSLFSISNDQSSTFI